MGDTRMEKRRIDYVIKKVKFGGYDIKEVDTLLKELFNDLNQAEKVLSEKQEEFTNSYYLITKERDELIKKLDKCDSELKKMKEHSIDADVKIKTYKEKMMVYEKKMYETEEIIKKLKVELKNSRVNNSEKYSADEMFDSIVNQTDIQLSNLEMEIDCLTRENLDLINKNGEYLSDIALLKQKNDELLKTNDFLKDKYSNLNKSLYEEQNIRKRNETKLILETFEKEKKQRYAMDLLTSTFKEMRKHIETLEESINKKSDEDKLQKILE